MAYDMPCQMKWNHRPLMTLKGHHQPVPSAILETAGLLVLIMYIY